MKKQPKRVIISKWKGKISEAKKAYNFVKKKGWPKFEDTENYKIIKQREKQALKRLEKRDEINAERREKYARKKELEQQQENLSYFDVITVFKAYSGNGRIFETNTRKLIEDRKAAFYGTITYNKRKYTYTNLAKYSMKLNSILSYLYNKKDKNGGDYSAFHWNVERSYLYNVETNTMYVENTFFNEQEKEQKQDE